MAEYTPIPEKSKQEWSTAECVCFDVDSTVVTEEAINVEKAFTFAHSIRFWLSFVVVGQKLLNTPTER